MVVINMNSKRIRRPNVRLWEVGDLSAAFACTVSKRCKAEKWIYDPYFGEESEHLQISAKTQFKYPPPDPDVSPRMILKEGNREKKDPYFLKQVSLLTIPRKVTKSKSRLDFGTVTRKARVMKRRRHSVNSPSRLFGGPWQAVADPGISGKYRKGYDRSNDKAFSASDAGFKDSSDDETPSMCKEPGQLQITDPELDTEMQWKSNEFVAKTDVAKTAFGHDVNDVKDWLEDLGLANLALLFEIHEVDEEALPLLTLEDLKEMGIVAVGPRRKLFAAIQQLRGAQ